MKVLSFSHVAITVSDFNRTARFYRDNFGARLVGVNTDHDVARLRSFFGVEGDDPGLTIGWLRVPGGATIEVFAFRPPADEGHELTWTRQGLTHLSFNVHDTERWHTDLVAAGVHIVAPPERSPKGHTFLFVADPDGNLIELIDNRHMRAVLRWLGPLGGRIFERTLYRRYYRRPSH